MKNWINPDSKQYKDDILYKFCSTVKMLEYETLDITYKFYCMENKKSPIF